MTNARVTRARRKQAEDLVAARNSLLDILNGVVLHLGKRQGRDSRFEGDDVLFIPDEAFLGQSRHPIEAVQVPGGIAILRRNSMTLDDSGIMLFRTPVAKA